MPRTGRPKSELVLTDEERGVLERLTARRKSAQGIALRARIVLACASGRTNQDVATQLRVNQATVGKWRRRFVERRLEGLFDEPRPEAERTITDDQVEDVVIKTLEDKPVDATHWSTRSMARATGMSQTAISKIWRAFGLQPHRAESFKLSTDPQCIEKVRDIVGLYLDPPERAVVLCTDEKSQIQALNPFQPILTTSASTRSAPHPRLPRRRMSGRHPLATTSSVPQCNRTRHHRRASSPVYAILSGRSHTTPHVAVRLLSALPSYSSGQLVFLVHAQCVRHHS